MKTTSFKKKYFGTVSRGNVIASCYIIIQYGRKLYSSDKVKIDRTQCIQDVYNMVISLSYHMEVNKNLPYDIYYRDKSMYYRYTHFNNIYLKLPPTACQA